HHNSIYLSFIQGGDGHRCRPSFPTRRSSDLAIQAGDALVGLRSNGLHTNGYALARKVFEGIPLIETVSRELLAPHTSYLDDLRRIRWKGAAHITGGGVPGNLPRCLPEGLAARLEKDAW